METPRKIKTLRTQKLVFRIPNNRIFKTKFEGICSKEPQTSCLACYTLQFTSNPPIPLPHPNPPIHITSVLQLNLLNKNRTIPCVHANPLMPVSVTNCTILDKICSEIASKWDTAFKVNSEIFYFGEAGTSRNLR